jgi:hypothetical protein
MSASRLITLLAALSLVIASCGGDDDPSGPGQPPPPPPPPPAAAVLMAAANITGCGIDNDHQTAALIMKDSSATVLAVGDMTTRGNLADFHDCYGPSWGQFKARTFPVMGNHEYGELYERANLDSVIPYFAERIPEALRAGGYYSFNVGAWHVVVINDNWEKFGMTDGPDAAQAAWLRADLAAATNKCVLAAFHQSRFMSSATAGWTARASRRSTWDLLDSAGVDVVINGHEHFYERMKPMLKDGTADSTLGMRQFTVGTGGESLHTEAQIVAIHPNSEVRIHRYGVLRMELEAAGYKWQFLPDDGSAALDSGSGACR